MKTKTVNRTIHPDTHDSKNSYRVKIGKKNYYDQLVVNVDHEKLGVVGTYIFEGKQIGEYESLHFKAEESNGIVSINWVENIAFKKV